MPKTRRWRALAPLTAAALAAGAVTGAALPAQAAAASGKASSSTGKPAAAPSAGTKVGANAPKLADGYGPTPAQQQAMAAASKQAAATGKPVTISALTTETWQVSAEPGGGYSLAANPEPVRAKQGASWVSVDTTLHRDADGTYSPAATAYANVRFSGGGSAAPLVGTTATGGGSYQLSWPTALPAPTVSGSTATYAGVLPGVDLEVSATVSGGFSEVLVVHSAAAAANPRLATLTLAARGTSAEPAKGVLASAPGGALLQESGALMWDSRTALAPAVTSGKAALSKAAQTTDGQIAAADPSTSAAPGLAARTASVGVSASGGALTLTPDKALLTAKDASWPEYIDPNFSWHPASGGTPAFDEVKQDSPCNGASYYNNSGSNADYGQLGVGYVPSAYSSVCEGIQRAFYQWQLPSAIYGATINTATVEVGELWQASFNCSLSRTVNLHWSGGIGSGTDWNNQPGYLGGSGAYDGSTSVGAAYNGTGCPHNGYAYGGFNVQSPIQISANNHSSQITFALTDDAEESARTITSFARFSDNPTLNIAFGHAPNTPGASQMSASSGASDVAGCATASPYPFIGKAIASNPIQLTASSISSPDGDPLQATFKYWLTGSSTTYTGLSADDIASGKNAVFSLPSTFTSGLTNGQNVSWQVRTTNGALDSGWSPTCTFTAEPNAPDAPAIGANSTYPTGETGAAAQTPATFQVTGNTRGGAAAKFYYNLDIPPATSGTSAGEIARPTGTTVTTPANWWQLTDGSGTSAANTEVAANAGTLSSSGATWTSDATRTEALALNGSSGYVNLPDNLIENQGNLTVHLRFKTKAGGILFSTGHTGIGAGSPSTGAMPVLYVGSNGKLYGQFWTGAVNPILSASAVNDGTWHDVDLVGATSSETMYLDGTQAGSISGSVANLDPMDFAGAGYVNTDGWAGLTASSFSYFNGELSDLETYSSALSASQVSSMYSTNNAALTIAPPSAGPHTLYVEAVDEADDVSATASYSFIAAGHASTACASLAACFDNTAISSDSAPTQADADGAGTSFSANDLANGGWTSGGKVTVDGASLALPAFGAGQADNVLAANQTVNYDYAVPSTGASSLMFLVTGTNADFSEPGSVAGDDTAPYVPGSTGVAGSYCFTGTTPNGPCAPQGTITYTNGTTQSTQSYDLTAPDWVSGPSSFAAVVLPHRNTHGGQLTLSTKLYAFSVPLTPGLTVQSITLPDVSNQVGDGTTALHVFSIGTRNTTVGTVTADGSTVPTTSPTTWTGAWAQDNEGNYNFQSGNFSAQSFRVLLQPTVTGGVIRVKLDNALGTSLLNIGHATVALTNGTAISPTSTLASAPVNLTFANSTSVKIPEGGMVYSDPLPFAVTAGKWIAVSFEVANSVPDLVQHSFATDSFEYVTPVNAGDYTATTSTSEYTAAGSSYGGFTDLVTGLDVQTSGMPTQIVLGDNLIDAWQNNTAPLSPNQGNALRLSDDIAAAEPTTPDAYGTVNAGIESNQITVDNPETLSGAGAVGGPSVLSRIDRDVLDEPGLSTLVFDEGLEDALTGQSITNLQNGINDLITETSGTQTAAGGSSFVNTVAVGLIPCATYGGDGSTGTGTNANDPCSAAVDAVRTNVNNFLANGTALALNQWTPSMFYYLNPDAVVGVPDTSNGETRLAPLAMVGTSRNNTPADEVNLTNAGTAALADAILAAQDTWALNDGTGASGADYAPNNQSNGYLAATDPNAGDSPLGLNGTYTWTNDATRGQVLGLDGSTAYGATTGPVLNTANSFTISAWVNLSSLAKTATVAAQEGTDNCGFYLWYNIGWKGWAFSFASADSTTFTWNAAGTTTAPTVNTWYHLVGVYNAGAKTAQLYVNGTLAATGTGITGWNAPGNLVLGASYSSGGPLGDYFPGMISNVQAWNYAVSAQQVTALYDQIS